MKTNNSYITNSTLETINNSALTIARLYNGKISRNDTLNSEKKVFSDEELTKYHDSIYIARVEFSEEKHNALEITATAKQFYVAYGDTLSSDIVNALALEESATKRERKEKWNMKNKSVFSLDTFKEIVQRQTETETAKSDTKKETTKRQTAKNTNTKSDTKKRATAKKESVKTA